MRDKEGSRGAISRFSCGWFRTKSLDAILQDSEKPEHQLSRQLGPVQLTLLGIGAIIGAGIFATIGTAAAGDANRDGAGPALMISFTITSIVCGFTALCYAEFASMIPISGSAYTYAYATLGELVAWIIGWDLVIEYAVGNIGVAISWANYFKTFLKGICIPWLNLDQGIYIPDWLSMDYRTATKVQGVLENAPHLFGVPVIFNAVAVSIVVLITIILVIGVRESAWFNAIMVAIKIVVLSFFIIVGFLWVNPDNWTPFAPKGWGGISAGAAIVFFAYIGFDAVSTVAEETRNPKRSLPIGIIASLLICTVFYVIVSAVFTGLISYSDLEKKLATEQAEPLTMALEHANPAATWAVGVVAFGSVVAHTAVLLVFQLGQPRIFFSMARDGLLPQAFARVHHRFRTPYVGTILTGIFVASIATFADISDMVDLTNIGTLFAFILVCGGIIILRRRDPARERPFRVPGGWVWALGLYALFAGGIFALQFTGMISPLSETTIGIILGIAAVVFAVCRNHIFPVLGILSCFYLIYYLPPNSWLRFAAWLNFGFVIYVGYGAVHSRLNGRNLCPRPAEHDAGTAKLGFNLAWFGAGLLLVMHALHLCLSSWTENKTLEGMTKLRTALRAVFMKGGWLHLEGGLEGAWRNEIVWFLLLPLALNAFILCPIVIHRGMRARQEGGPVPRLTASLVGAAAILIMTGAYFIGILVYNLT
jgi:APA family basic amino acid/polyamine antiporter